MIYLSRSIPVFIYAAISFWYLNGLALFSQSTLSDSFPNSQARWHLQVGGELAVGEPGNEFFLFSYLLSDLGFYLQQQDAGGYHLGRKSYLLNVGAGYQVLPNWRADVGVFWSQPISATGPNSARYYQDIFPEEEPNPGLSFYSSGRFRVQGLKLGGSFLPLPVNRRFAYRWEPQISAGFLLFLSSLKVNMEGELITEDLQAFPIDPGPIHTILPALGLYAKLGLDYYFSPRLSLQASIGYQSLPEMAFPGFTPEVPDAPGTYEIPPHRYRLSGFMLQTGLQFHLFAK